MQPETRADRNKLLDMAFSQRGTRNDVVSSLNYYDDPCDGSLPEPVYIEA